MQIFTASEPNTTTRRCYIFLVDATDGITPETGEAGGQPEISINGGGFTPTTGILVAIGNGAYYVALTQAELGAKGFILVRYKSANTAEFQALALVSGIELYRVGVGGS